MTKRLLQSLMVFCCLAPLAVAQPNVKLGVSPQTERVVMKFARQHHAELATLLQQLKEIDEGKYHSAILELSRTYDRLERSRQRSKERYETDLDLWKIDSRVKLLVARSIGGMEEETRAEIKQLLLRRNRIRHDQLVVERDRLQSRLIRVEEQVEELKTRSDVVAEQEMERLLKSVSRLSNSKSNVNRVQPQKSSSVSTREKNSASTKKKSTNKSNFAQESKNND